MAVGGESTENEKESGDMHDAKADTDESIAPGGGRLRNNIFKTSIEAKILGLTSLLIFIGFASYAFISINQEQNDMIEQQEQMNHSLATSMHASLNTSMLAGMSNLTEQALNSLQNIDEVSQVKVYNTDGSEVFNGRGSANGVVKDELNKVMNTGEISMFYQGEGSSRVLTEIHALPNEAACQACHADGLAMRGAVLVSTSTQRVDESIRTNMIFSIVALLLTLILIIIALKILLKVTLISKYENHGDRRADQRCIS